MLHQDNIIVAGHQLKWVSLDVFFGSIIVGVTQRLGVQSGYTNIAIDGALVVGSNNKLSIQRNILNTIDFQIVMLS